MEKRDKFLINNTIIFAIGNFFTKLITFLMVPIYTSALSTEQFGIVDLLYTICSFLVPIFSFNIVESILRFSLDKDSENNKVMSIGIVAIICMVIMSLIVIPIMGLFNNYKDYNIYFYLYLISLGTSQIFLTNLKGQEKLKIFSIGNFLYAFFVSFFNLIFLVVLKMGIKGYFLAYIISNIVIILFSFIFGNVKESLKNFCFDKKLFINMIKYSIILIPTSFMWWIMNFLDRIMITKYISLSANGIYAVSYKIPTILTVVSSIFTQAWLFSAIKEKNANDSVEYTNRIFDILSFGTILVGSFLLIVIKPLFRIYVDINYYEAWKYVAYLMIGYVFLNLSTFISTSYSVNKDSKGYLFSALVGAVVNFILNFLLIPLLGVSGAALATLISYICVFLYRLVDTRKYLEININVKFISSILLMIVISILLFYSNIYTVVVQILCLGLIVLLYKDTWLILIKGVLNKIRREKN